MNNDDRQQRGRIADPQIGQLPPHSPEAEQGVLGCCLLSPAECIGDAAELLTEPDAFYDLSNRTIWEHVRKLDAQRRGAAEGAAGSSVDVITLQQSLKDAGLLENVGGVAYLASLPDLVPSAANLAYYVDIVRKKWLLRRVVKACQETIFEVYSSTQDEQDVLAQCEKRVMQACETRLPSSEVSFRHVALDVQEHVLEKFQRGVKRKIGPMTGFNYLDNIVPGFGGGQMIVLAARPRTGKSALMMQVLENMALKEKAPVALFSLEMTSRSLGTRAIFQRAGADVTKFWNGFMSDVDVANLMKAGLDLGKAPLWVDDCGDISMEDLEIKARRMVRKYGIRVFGLDYFQLLYVRNGKRQWSRSDELAHCSKRIKVLAKELDVTFYVAAQLNREIEKETHRRPRLSDLKDTGQLEQDADVVKFLWLPDMNLENPRVRERLEEMIKRVPCREAWKSWEKNAEGKTWKYYLKPVTCTVEKQREGRSGEDAALMFIKPWTRFVDGYRPQVVKEEQPEQEPEEREEREAML